MSKFKPTTLKKTAHIDGAGNGNEYCFVQAEIKFIFYGPLDDFKNVDGSLNKEKLLKAFEKSYKAVAVEIPLID